MSVVYALGVTVRDLERPTAMGTWRFNVSKGGRVERIIDIMERNGYLLRFKGASTVDMADIHRRGGDQTANSLDKALTASENPE